MQTKSQYRRPLPNPVFQPVQVQDVKDAIVASRMERDPWYQWNIMGRLLRSVQLGQVTESIYRNVAAHLNAVANRRNAI